MSLQFRIAEQVLKVDDTREATEAVVHKYDAFLTLLCADRYSFQKEAVRETLCFLASHKYPDLERLARENWNARETIRQRHDSLEAYLDKMPLRDRKSVSLDVATGTGKSFVMYALAAIALAEGLAARVLVLCPSLTIEEELLEKFAALAGNSELFEIMKELGTAAIPAIKRGNQTIQRGDICIENIHAVYEKTGSSIRDSFRGRGARSLVLNDEAHHLFSPPDKGLKEWMKFLQHGDFGFRQIVNVTGTPYVGNEYFPDIVFRYGLKQAIADKVVKKPNYKIEETYKAHDWQKTYAIHQQNCKDYGKEVKPISIVVTQEIVRCVEVWRELVDFLVTKEKLSRNDAERKAIWITSGVPTSGDAKKRVEAVYSARGDKDSPEKRRKENLALLKQVDHPASPVEWIVSVSMLTEGWDVKNVFQIVPHESRAFSSKLLIAQVLGRGLRVPPGLTQEPLVTINNHQAWSDEIGNLLKEVLEVENTLYWGYEPRRKKFVFPLYNLRYEPEQKTVETKREQAREPQVDFVPQDRKTTEYSTFSETGKLAVEIAHRDLFEIDDAVKLMRLFVKEKSETIAAAWPKKRLKEFIVSRLKNAGQDVTFLSKENLLRLQQGCGPMFRDLDSEHPRMSQTAKDIVPVDLSAIPHQSFSESMLKEHGTVWFANEEAPPYGGHELHLWEQYLKWKKISEIDDSGLAEDVRIVAHSIHQVDLDNFKSPWNVHYASHEPERQFSGLLFDNADLFDAFVKMPNMGGYAFPYSYKPAKAAKTHVVNENFNPDFFIKVAGRHDILVVEIKAEGDDSNRNRAKCRDGLKHFETLNGRLKDKGAPWFYHFYLLSPDDYTHFFQQVRDGTFEGWKSSLMQQLNG
jgi:type III restriction enzyme